MFSRHRNRIILAAILFLQLLLVAYQVRQDQDVSLIRQWTVRLVTPVQKSFHFVFDGISGLWRGYVDLRDARRENQELTRELNNLRLENLRLRSKAEQAKRLQALLELKEETQSETVTAQVIGSGAGPNGHLLIIDRGRDAGLRPDLPVIVPEGVVGKVLHAFPSAAQILPLTDRESGVACVLENSRIHGILKGKPPYLGTLRYVPNDEKVEIGTRLLTSGEDRIYPKGFPVGEVIEARPGETFQEITVQPFARLNRLEEVLVVVAKAGADLSGTPPAQGAARAALPDSGEPAQGPTSP